MRLGAVGILLVASKSTDGNIKTKSNVTGMSYDPVACFNPPTTSGPMPDAAVTSPV